MADAKRASPRRDGRPYKASSPSAKNGGPPRSLHGAHDRRQSGHVADERVAAAVGRRRRSRPDVARRDRGRLELAGQRWPAGQAESPAIAASDVRPGSAPPPYRGGNTFIGNMTGLPAIVVPCGFSAGPPVFPITMMLYGRPFDEATLFRVGHAYESATSWHTRRPALDTA